MTKIINFYIIIRKITEKKNEELMYEWYDVAHIFLYMSAKARQNNFLAYLVYQEHIKYMKGEGMPICDAARYSFLMTETGAKSPCIEFTDRNFSLDTFRKDRKTFCGSIKECNRNTPCFYNDAREIGVLWRKKWIILFNFIKIMRQLMKYGNFF